jgi:hypothetical protein
MPKIEEGKTAGTFLMDNLPYQKGEFEIKINGEIISIVRNSDGDIDSNNLANKSVLADWTDADGNGFITLGAFIDYAECVLFISPSGTAAEKQQEAIFFNGINTKLNAQNEQLERIIFLLKGIAE